MIEICIYNKINFCKHNIYEHKIIIIIIFFYVRFLEIELELLALTIHERAWRFSMLRRLLLNQRIVFSRRGYCFPLNLQLFSGW